MFKDNKNQKIISNNKCLFNFLSFLTIFIKDKERIQNKNKAKILKEITF